MNRTFRSLWNASLGTFVAAPETASDTGQTSNRVGGVRILACRLTPLALALALALAHGAHAGSSATQLPTGGVVQAGNAHIATSGNTLTVGQTSQRAVIQWDSFNVGRSAAVRFAQPDASSVTLNRVVGNEGSVIDGALKANGQVFLVNPNGVLFGRNAVVDVGGLVASTLDIPDADFMAGGSTFSLGARRGLVVNEGHIAAGEGGYIALIGQKVSNDGTLLARMGTVAMAAGDRVTLNFNGTSLVDVAIDRPTFDAMVANRQLIVADGGLVKLTAGTADALVSTVVNNTGTIRSRTVENRSGRIFLLGEGGGVEIGGTLDASAPTHGDGGFVETSGAKVSVADGVAITTAAADGRTGTWLVDPTDFTVAASGGDMTGATLTTLLASNNVTLQSSAGAASGAGNVNVNDAVNWSAHTLTLDASNDINVNAVMTANGSAGLNLKAASNAVNFGLASSGFLGRLDFSGTGVLQMNVNGVLTPFTVIHSASGLQAMQSGLSGNYALGSSIDLSGVNWTPVGSSHSTRFAGVFDGLGHTVDKMNITFAAAANTLYRGLFGSVSGIVRNVGVTNGLINIDGGAYAVGYIGLLAGQNVGEMRNVYATGNISVSSTNGNIGLKSGIGGLVGELNAAQGPARISNAFANAVVDATINGSRFASVGGLIGSLAGSLSNAYSTGSVAGYQSVGGLAGQAENYGSGTGIDHVYSTATVTGQASGIGGLVGTNRASIDHGYSTGSVNTAGTSPRGSVGGLIGWNIGQITNSYTTSKVNTTWANDPNAYYNGTGYAVGAVLGADFGYYDSAASRNLQSAVNIPYNADVAGSLGPVGFYYDTTVDPTYGFTVRQPSGVALTSAQMTTKSSYTALGWDFTNDWAMYEGHTAPLLRTFMRPLTISASIAPTKVYDGRVDAGTIVYSAPADPAHLFGTPTLAGVGKNVGTYTATPTGVWSDQQGYLITFVGGTTTVTPATLVVTATGGIQVYDGTRNAVVTLSSNAIAGDQLTLGRGSALMADKNVGAGKAVTVSGLSLSGPDAGNYVLASTSANTTTTVTPATLNVSASAASQRLTDGRNVEVALGSDPIGGDVVVIGSREATVADGSPGPGRAVTVTGLALSGPDAGNYVLSSGTATTTIDILPPPSAVVVEPPEPPASTVATGLMPDEGAIARAVQVPQALRAEGIAMVRLTSIPSASGAGEAAGSGTQAVFVYATPTGSASRSIDLDEVRSIAQVPSEMPVTVPVADAKFVSLLDGGVRLPKGVRQQFFANATSTR
jgi:filamentous hemagglutinin family protein